MGRLPYATVRLARIGGREPIPLLSEVLTSWPELRLNVDCKSRAAMDPLVRVINEHQAWDRVCIASFSMWSPSRLRSRLGPRVATSYTSIGVAGLRLLPTQPLRWLAVGHAGVAAQVPATKGPLTIVTPAFVSAAHALGKHVHVWTVDDQDELNRVLDLGVDGIFTVRPDVLHVVYVSRGIWRD